MKLRWRSTAEEAELVGVESGAVDLFTLSLSRLIRIREGVQYHRRRLRSDPFIAVVTVLYCKLGGSLQLMLLIQVGGPSIIIDSV